MSGGPHNNEDQTLSVEQCLASDSTLLVWSDLSINPNALSDIRLEIISDLYLKTFP